MRKVIRGIPKKTIEYILQLFSPTMDDYPYVLDLKEDSYLISSTAVQRFRLPADHFIHSREIHRQFVYPEDLPALWADLDRIQSGEKSDHNMDYRWLDRHGDPVWINCRGLVLYEQDGSPRYLIGCINEIGKKQKADNVSGLLGAGALWQYAQEFPAFLPDGFVMRLGMDDLGVVNSSFGMNFGDYLLKETADCIRRVMEPEQRLFRLVSDQFIIADLSGRNIRDAKQLYDRIRTEISSWVEAHQYQILFTVSAGIIGTGGRANDYDQFLKYLEFALNKAKRAGKNESYVFAEHDYEAWRRRQRLAKQLLYAVNNGYEGFEVYYQPVMNAPEHHLVSAEALMRFYIPAEAVSPHDSSEKEQRMVSPAEFIPILEESGLIIPAGRWLLHKAAADCKKWQKDCPGMRVQVNVSYVQVAKTNVLREIREALDELAVKIACDKISEKELQKLLEVKAQFENSPKTGDVKMIAEMDVKFHDVIFESTGNPKLVTLLNNLREQIYRYRVEYIKNPDNYPILIAEHNAIAEGLKNRDKEAATLAMHKHVKNQAVAVKSVIQCQDETESE